MNWTSYSIGDSMFESSEYTNLLGVYQSGPTSESQHEGSGLVFLLVDMQ